MMMMSYSLLHQHDTGSEVKITDNIFQKMHFSGAGILIDGLLSKTT